MNGLDFVIIAMFVIGAIRGLMTGFLRQVASIAGFFIGLLAAFLLNSAFGDWLAPRVGVDAFGARSLAFILLWIGIPVGLSFAAYLLTKALGLVGLGGLNRLGGAVVGGVKYLIFIGFLLNVAVRLQAITPETEAGSRCSRPVRSVSAFLFDICKTQMNKKAEQTFMSEADRKE